MTTAETVAFIGLRTFGLKVDALGRRRADAPLSRYAERAVALVALDAERRLHELESTAGGGSIASHYVPSLIDLAKLEVSEETRFSLLLAALLDVRRTGALSVRFWEKLKHVLVSRATASQQERPLSAVRLWTPDRIARASVTPTEHRIEEANLDVFARVTDDHGYHCGLVIENKVNPNTTEQDDQLDRYWRYIGDTYRAQDQTLFVFLTESERPIKTAKKSEDWWLHITWRHVAEILWQLADDEQLPFGHRLLALQLRDLIRSEILGLPTIGEDRHELAALRAALHGRPPGHPDWEKQHARITALWMRAVGGYQQ